MTRLVAFGVQRGNTTDSPALSHAMQRATCVFGATSRVRSGAPVSTSHRPVRSLDLPMVEVEDVPPAATTLSGRYAVNASAGGIP